MSIQEIGTQRKTAPNFVPASTDERYFGWQAFGAKWPLSRLTNDEQRRGWKAAQDAQAFSGAVEYLIDQGGSIEDDYEWIRRGC